jgi:predicted metal-dependent hydrolase
MSTSQPVQNQPNDQTKPVKRPKIQPQYPLTKVIDDDTVVIMTIQQGKDMNRKFVMLNESLKKINRANDTLAAMNTFLADYNESVLNSNSLMKLDIRNLNLKIDGLNDKIHSLTETNNSLVRKIELDQFRQEMAKNQMESRIELYKSEMQTKENMFNVQLELEKRRGQHNARQSAIMSGLIVGGVALTGALIGSWMPSSWFK